MHSSLEFHVLRTCEILLLFIDLAKLQNFVRSSLLCSALIVAGLRVRYD